MSEQGAPLKVTLKAGTGYDAPWITVEADSPDELNRRLDALGQSGALGQAAAVGVEFAAAFNAAAGLGAKPVQTEGTQQKAAWGGGQQQNTQPQQQDGGGPAPQCQHGARVFKSGNGKKGPWSAWMCPARQGDPSRCEPQWID